MADDEARMEQAMTRLRDAATAVARHPAEVEALAQAIVEALNAGWRPSQVEAAVPYDRNHVRRIAKARGVAARRAPTVVSRKRVEGEE
jgi:hypothetical protein